MHIQLLLDKSTLPLAPLIDKQFMQLSSSMKAEGEEISQMQAFLLELHLKPGRQEQECGRGVYAVFEILEQSMQGEIAPPINPRTKSHSHLSVLLFQK